MSQPPAFVDLASVRDDRGDLTVLDSWDALPFTPVRLFLVTGVPAGVRRGGHAWREGHELLVCASGSCTIDTECPTGCETFVLDRADRGLYLPPMVWMEYELSSPSASLMVLASTHYDPGDIIADHVTFLTYSSQAP